jgi:hypothetical protein
VQLAPLTRVRQRPVPQGSAPQGDNTGS